MARYPKAVWRPLPENDTQAKITPRSVILHSAVDHVKVDSLWNFFRHSSSFESHFFVTWAGVVEQYMDTTVRADANANANAFAISIETEDDGDPNTKRWSEKQADAIVDLIRWCCDTHRIPKQLCTTWDGPGVGWHTMWGAPSKWTPARGKTCPGTIRVPQFRNEIWPRIVAGTTGGDDDLTPEQTRQFDRLIAQADEMHTALVKHYAKDGGNVLNLDLARPILNMNHWISVVVPDLVRGVVPQVVEGVIARLPATAGGKVDAKEVAAAINVEAIAQAVRNEFARKPLTLDEGDRQE